MKGEFAEIRHLVFYLLFSHDASLVIYRYCDRSRYR
jgi:hypothetical protein